MNEIYKELKLSVYGDPGADSAYAKQLDADSGGVIITMMDGDQAVEADSSCTAKLRVLKPDGKSCDGPATIEDGKIKAKYTDQMLAVSGRCLADVTLTDGTGKRLSTMSFVLIVERVPYGNHIDSINEYTTFQEALDTVTEQAAAADTSATLRLRVPPVRQPQRLVRKRRPPERKPRRAPQKKSLPTRSRLPSQRLLRR